MNLFKDFIALDIQKLFYQNALYCKYKLNLIDFKPRTYIIYQKNNLTIPAIKTLKSRSYLAPAESDILITFQA